MKRVLFIIAISIAFCACTDLKDCSCTIDGKKISRKSNQSTIVSDWSGSCSDISPSQIGAGESSKVNCVEL